MRIANFHGRSGAKAKSARMIIKTMSKNIIRNERVGQPGHLSNKTPDKGTGIGLFMAKGGWRTRIR